MLDAMERESCSERAGFAGILARLADVVASFIVRGWVECGCGDATGWVRAARPEARPRDRRAAPRSGPKLERRGIGRRSGRVAFGVRRAISRGDWDDARALPDRAEDAARRAMDRT